MSIRKIILATLIFGASSSTLAGRSYTYSPECPSDKPIMSKDTKECFGCDYEGAFVAKHSFASFTKRIYKGCTPPESGGKIVKKETNEKGEEIVTKIYGCIDEGEEVDVCNNRESFNITVFHGDIGTTETVNLLKECPKDKPLRTVEGCFSCDDLQGRRVLNVKDCEVCSNRFSSKPAGDVESAIYCALKQCPPNTFRKDKTWSASCISCEETDAVMVEEQSDCEVCSNREYKSSCSYAGCSCALKECPPNYFRDHIGRCHKCSYEGYAVTEKNECTKCPEREAKESDFAVHTLNEDVTYTTTHPYVACLLKECPDSAPVRWERGDCGSCDYIGAGWKTTESDCKRCPNTEYEDGKCVEKCQEDMFRAADGWCTFCQVIAKKEASSEECAKCPNREYVDGKCILKQT